MRNEARAAQAMRRKSELLSLVPMAQRGANGSQQFSGTGLPLTTLPFDLQVAAVSGTSPTLNVVIESSVDQGATYQTVASFAQKTAPGAETIQVPVPHRDYMRVRYTLGGTNPQFTFSVSCDFYKIQY